MCGIAGVVLGDRKWKSKHLEKIRVDFANLLVQAQVRGTHAAGAMVISPKGTMYIKAPISAEKLVESEGFWKLLDTVDGDTTAIVGHTRFATQGPARVNENNHPIEEYPIIGVHNGMLSNDEELKKLYGTALTPEVDSAAVFAMLRHKSMGADFLTAKVAKDGFEEVEGSFALAFADLRRPEALFLVRHQNPLYVRCNPERKTIHFASTDSIIRGAMGDPKHGQDQYPLKDDTLVRVTKESANGAPLMEQPFKAAPDPYTKYTGSYTGGYNTGHYSNYRNDWKGGSPATQAADEDEVWDTMMTQAEIEAEILEEDALGAEILDARHMASEEMPAGVSPAQWAEIKDWIESKKSQIARREDAVEVA
jgi:predicted glutamine amidotransferase